MHASVRKDQAKQVLEDTNNRNSLLLSGIALEKQLSYMELMKEA